MIKIILFASFLKFITPYERVSPVFSFNNTISCGSTKYYNNFPNDCGISNVQPTINGQILNTRLINGEDSRKLSWPWLVYIAEEQSKNIKFKCSGSLISKQYVLTLMSCLENGIDTTNLVAIINLNKSDSIINNVSESNIYKVTTIHIQITSNLALIKLARDVDISIIKPICLPNSDDNSKIFSKSVVVTSW